MQIFSFGDDPTLGYILDVASDADGTIFLLSYDYSDPAIRTRYYISRCNYRGEFQQRIEVTGLPEAFAGILPDRMLYAGQRLHLLSGKQLQLVTVETDGRYASAIDFEGYILERGEQLDSLKISGLSIEDSGTIFFSVAVKFRVYRLGPDGKVVGFGRGGSAPGQFGVVAGVDTDSRGHVYVTDKARNVVMVFDRDFRFLTEFGYRNAGPEALVRPQDVVTGVSGKLYITQVGNRGVAVFQVHDDDQSHHAVNPVRGSAGTRKEVPASTEQGLDEFASLQQNGFNVPTVEILLRHGKSRRESEANAHGSLTVATAGLPE
jgi:hypothetical protein